MYHLVHTNREINKDKVSTVLTFNTAKEIQQLDPGGPDHRHTLSVKGTMFFQNIGLLLPDKQISNLILFWVLEV